MDAVGLKALDEGYSFLDLLPDDLVGPVIGGAGGTLQERVESVVSLRAALLDGRLPDVPLAWPSSQVSQRFLQQLADLRLPHFCRGRPDLTDLVVRSVLEVAADGFAGAETAFLEELRRLEALERRKVEESVAESKSNKGRLKDRFAALAEQGNKRRTMRPDIFQRMTAERAGEDVSLPEAVQAAITARAREAQQQWLATHVAQALEQQWRELVRLWTSLEEVFSELGDQLGLGWDLSLGVLRSTGWKELLRLAELVKKLEPLREVVRTLGRLRASEADTDETNLRKVIERLRRATEVELESLSPFVTGETRGITRSDEISRMLPSEAVLLGHPTLRLLWHARRAERSLTTYLVEGVWTDRVSMEGEVQVEREVPSPRNERGPILVCLDTSGSMAGVPEQVAKAVVLESMRVAHAEGRACHLYNFSGPGQVEEHPLSLTPDGLAQLLQFLMMSFGGGTDVAAPIARAVERLNAEAWNRADILMLTDGEFAVGSATVDALKAARVRHKVRVQGILIGNQTSEAMNALCDDIARFTDWGAVAG